MKPTYDNTFVAGDLITMYSKGYYRFVKYEDRGAGLNPLVHGVKAYNNKGHPVKASKSVCDVSWCERAAQCIRHTELLLQRLLSMQPGKP